MSFPDPSAGGGGLPWRRALALCLVVIIAGHALPFAFPVDGPAPAAAEGGAQAWFKALSVCDDGSDSGGFPADHPWMPAPAAIGLFLPEMTCCSISSGACLPQGCAMAVFRPPRPVLS